MTASSFDEFFRNGGYKPGDEPQAFADWLAEQTGRPVIGESEAGDIVIGQGHVEKSD